MDWGKIVKYNFFEVFMKVNKFFFCFVIFYYFLNFSCVCAVKNEKKSGYNEDDMAKYAKCVNELAVQNQIGTFLWDCSTHMDRNKMKISFPKYIDAIMSCYPKKSDFGNGS